MATDFEMGPVLKLRSVTDELWSLSAIVVSVQKPGPLRWQVSGSSAQDQATSIAPELLWKVGGKSLWRYAFDIPLLADDQTIEYGIAGSVWTFRVPGAGHIPNIAYASCNGFSSLKAMKSVSDKYAMWSKLACGPACKRDPVSGVIGV